MISTNNKSNTYIGNKVLELVDSIRQGDPVLYNYIQQNEYLPEALKSFDRNLNKFEKRLTHGEDNN